MGGATGPQVGETVDAQPMLDDGGEGFLWLRDYSLFFSLAKIASQSLFLECKFKSLSGRIYQMSVFPANL